MPYAYIGTILPYFAGFTAYTPEIPKLYWDVKSQEQRIKAICMELHKAVCYMNAVADQVNGISGEIEQILADFQAQVQKQLADQDVAMQKQIAAQDAKVTAQLLEMKQYIDAKFDNYAQGMLLYDVTTGEYRPSEESTRRLFQALSYSHTGARQLVSDCAQNLTVGQMAGKTVYNVAYSDRATIALDDQIMN